MRRVDSLEKTLMLGGMGAGGEGDDRGWDGWMASLTQCTWVWVNSGSWWWTGSPGMLRFMGSQRVGHDWVTDLIWSDLILAYYILLFTSNVYVLYLKQVSWRWCIVGYCFMIHCDNPFFKLVYLDHWHLKWCSIYHICYYFLFVAFVLYSYVFHFFCPLWF